MCECVHAWVRVGVRASVCHADFSKTTTATDFFCKLIFLMNFHVLENFVGFVDLGLKVSE